MTLDLLVILPAGRRLRAPRIAAFAVFAAAFAFQANRAQAQEGGGFMAALERDMTAAGVKTPPDLEKAVSEGVTELQSGNWILAAQRLGDAYRQSRDHPLPPLLIGVACVGMKQYEKASEFVRYAMLKWPGMADASPPLRSWLGGADSHAKMLKVLEDELFARKPGSAEGSTALFLSGFFNAFGGDVPKASKFLLAVPDGSKEHAAARLLLKTVRGRLPGPPVKRADRAEQASRLLAEGRYAEAAHAFGAAVVENPGDALSWFEMGHALFACGYFRHAARVIAVGLDLEPAWAGLEIDIESLYPEQRRQEYRAQLAALETWVASHADDASSRFLLSYMLHFSARRQDAAPHFAAAASGGWSRHASLFMRPESAAGSLPDPGGNTPSPTEKPPSERPPDPGPVKPQDKEQPKPAERDIVAEGAARLATGDAEGAAKLFTVAFSDPKLQARAMAGFACVNAARGDSPEGARWVRAAYKSSPDAVFSGEFTAAFKSSVLLSKKLDELVGRCAAIDTERSGGRKLAREDMDAWLLCGFCLMQAGRLKEARARFNEILLEFEDAEEAAIEGFARASAAIVKKG